MQDKQQLIANTINSTLVTECSTVTALNRKVWQVLRAQQPPMSDCESAEKFRLVGNFAGGLGVTQVDGFWLAAGKRNSTGTGTGKAKAIKGLLSDEEKLSKEYAIKGMEAAGNAALAPLIDALKQELADHEAAKKAAAENSEKAQRKELLAWWKGLSPAEQEEIYKARRAL